MLAEIWDCGMYVQAFSPSAPLYDSSLYSYACSHQQGPAARATSGNARYRTHIIAMWRRAVSRLHFSTGTREVE